VYFVGLTEDVRGVFTRAKIWELLGLTDHTATSLDDCMLLIERYGGNLSEARTRADSEGRQITAEITRLQDLQTQFHG
jgi:hypothetical protein